MKHEDAIYFEGKVVGIGDSIAIIIPKSNALYLGIGLKDIIRVKITKIQQ
jgi:putative transposon-encoded protein